MTKEQVDTRYAKWRAETDALLAERAKLPQEPCAKPDISCTKRGKFVRDIQCPLPSCSDKIVMLKILQCPDHGECSLSAHAGVKWCGKCDERKATT